MKSERTAQANLQSKVDQVLAIREIEKNRPTHDDTGKKPNRRSFCSSERIHRHHKKSLLTIPTKNE